MPHSLHSTFRQSIFYSQLVVKYLRELEITRLVRIRCALRENIMYYEILLNYKKLEREASCKEKKKLWYYTPRNPSAIRSCTGSSGGRLPGR